MIKKGIKIAAGVCMAACLVAGLFLFNNGVSKADGEVYLANYDFEDGNNHADDFMKKGSLQLVIEDGNNSTAGEEYGETVEGNTCVKVTNRANGGDWWERNCACFDLKKLTPGVKYHISVDVMHQNDEVPEKGYTALRAFKFGTYYNISDSLWHEYENDDAAHQAEVDERNAPIIAENDARAERNKEIEERNIEHELKGEPLEPLEELEDIELYNSPHTYKYGQIGSLKGAEKGVWERIEGDITVKDDVFERNEDYYLFIFMAYPEDAGQGTNVSYQDRNTEEYYIDNFRVYEVPEATATPEPTAAPQTTPTAAPVDNSPVAPVNIVDEPDLEVGYEDVVKGITYVVTGKDTVSVVGFDDPKSKIVIPASIKLEGFPYKVTKINNKAFQFETDVKSLTIGANVKQIGKSAFFGCTSMKTIKVNSKVLTKIGKNAFKNTPKKAKAKVPKAKKKAYAKSFKKAGFKGKVK